MKNKYTLMGDVICNQREKLPICCIYANKMPIEWGKMKSRRYCEKMMTLFGVDNLDSLKEAVRKCTFDEGMKYSGSWDAAPAILNCIKVEEIGTLN